MQPSASERRDPPVPPGPTRDSAMREGSRVSLARYIALPGVVSSVLLGVILFLSGFMRAVYLSVDAFRDLGRADALKTLMIAAVRHADVLLIATALLVIGLGLYSIFIDRVERLPRWLAIRGFEDLKEKLTGVVVVALAVDFFTVALEWNGSRDILAFGGAIGAVLLGLSGYALVHQPRDRGNDTGSAQSGEDAK